MQQQSALRKTAALTVVIGMALSLGACKIVKNEPKKKQAKGELEIFFSDDKFNADKIVAEMWDAKLLPFANKNAVPLADVLSALGEDPVKAGAQFGYREKPEGSPWNYVVKATAKVVEINTASRAATVGLDVAPFDGKTDAVLQIGPVLKGSAIRDSLDFLKFDDFTNQLEFARISNALNKKVNQSVLSGLDREALNEKMLTFTGMFTDNGPKKPYLITPVSLQVGNGG